MQRSGGYDPNRPGYMYFMVRGSERQIGITGNPQARLATHRRNGWQLVELTGAMPGWQALAVEGQVKRHLRRQQLLLPGSTEEWDGRRWNPGSLQQIWAQTGVTGFRAGGGSSEQRWNYKPPAAPAALSTPRTKTLSPVMTSSLGIAAGVFMASVLTLVLWTLFVGVAAASPWGAAAAATVSGAAACAARPVGRWFHSGWLTVYWAIGWAIITATVLLFLGWFAVPTAAAIGAGWLIVYSGGRETTPPPAMKAPARDWMGYPVTQSD